MRGPEPAPFPPAGEGAGGTLSVARCEAEVRFGSVRFGSEQGFRVQESGGERSMLCKDREGDT